MKKFLIKICKINRNGLSIHSFRHSDISEWEAEGWPHVVGMACSGTVNPINYLNYASAVRQQLESISHETHSCWAHADTKRRPIFTRRQLFEALVDVIQKSKEETLQQLKESHYEQLQAIRQASQQQIVEIVRCHTVQVQALQRLYEAQLSQAHAQRRQFKQLDFVVQAVTGKALPSNLVEGLTEVASEKDLAPIEMEPSGIWPREFFNQDRCVSLLNVVDW